MSNFINRRRYNAFLFLLGLGVAIVSLPLYVHAQSLNDAVANQLRTINGIPCFNLRQPARPLSDFEGGLLQICSRAAQQSSSPAANSSGGGAATPTRLSSVIQRRLNHQKGDEKQSTVFALRDQWSLFASVEYEGLDRDVTARQDGFNSRVLRLTGGVDKQILKWLLAGMGLTYRNQLGAFKGGGNFETDAFGVIGYATFNPFDQMFVQVSGGYDYERHDRARIASFTDTFPSVSPFNETGIVDSNFDANQFSVGALFGYDLNFGMLTVGPRAGIDWLRQQFETYSEDGNTGLELRYDKNTRTSLQTLLGVVGSVAFSTNFGVITPQVGVNWRHEFKDKAREIAVSFVDDIRSQKFTYKNDSQDRNFFEFNIGTGFVFKHGFNAFVNYRALLGHSFLDSHAGTIGIRLEL